MLYMMEQRRQHIKVIWSMQKPGLVCKRHQTLLMGVLATVIKSEGKSVLVREFEQMGLQRVSILLQIAPALRGLRACLVAPAGRMFP